MKRGSPARQKRVFAKQLNSFRSKLYLLQVDTSHIGSRAPQAADITGSHGIKVARADRQRDCGGKFADPSLRS
jgi:hypothetical protein